MAVETIETIEPVETMETIETMETVETMETFVPFFFPSFLPPFLSFILPPFLPSFLSSFLSSFLPFFLPCIGSFLFIIFLMMRFNFFWCILYFVWCIFFFWCFRPLCGQNANRCWWTHVNTLTRFNALGPYFDAWLLFLLVCSTSLPRNWSMPPSFSCNSFFHHLAVAKNRRANLQNTPVFDDFRISKQ